MASVKITGIVKTTSKDYLANVWEEYFVEIKGSKREFKRKWTVWFSEAHKLEEGDRVTIEGLLGTKVVDWQAPDGAIKTLIDHVINEPKVLEIMVKKEKTRDLDDEAKYGTAPF